MIIPTCHGQQRLSDSHRPIAWNEPATNKVFLHFNGKNSEPCPRFRRHHYLINTGIVKNCVKGHKDALKMLINIKARRLKFISHKRCFLLDTCSSSPDYGSTEALSIHTHDWYKTHIFYSVPFLLQVGDHWEYSAFFTLFVIISEYLGDEVQQGKTQRKMSI